MMMNNILELVFDETSNIFYQYTDKKILLTRIDSNTLNAWSKNWVPINRRKPPNGGWDWKFKMAHFQKNYQEYLFDIAIFSENGDLSGLTLGKKSRSQGNLSIYYLEGSPSQSDPLKGYIFSIINIVTWGSVIPNQEFKN